MVIPRKPDSPNGEEGIRRDYTSAPKISPAYLLGVLHDATKSKTTYRIASKSKDFCLLIQQGIKLMNVSAWIYKEGKNRNVWITEFSQSLLRKIKFNILEDILMQKVELLKAIQFDTTFISPRKILMILKK